MIKSRHDPTFLNAQFQRRLELAPVVPDFLSLLFAIEIS
jgi:hypothetical protein